MITYRGPAGCGALFRGLLLSVTYPTQRDGWRVALSRGRHVGEFDSGGPIVVSAGTIASAEITRWSLWGVRPEGVYLGRLCILFGY